MIVRALSYFQGEVSRITLSISIRNNEAQISAFLFSLFLQTDQQQRHCRSRNPDRCAIGSSSRPRSTPLEKQLERGKREIYTYIYIYIQRSRGNAREWKLRTAMSISHQACCCSSFNIIITRRGKRKRGLDMRIRCSKPHRHRPAPSTPFNDDDRSAGLSVF